VTEHATCDFCRKLRPLTAQGVIGLHYIGLNVSARVVPVVGRGRVKRRCPGSYRRPRRPLGER
jgi:hypothetical protein